SGGPGAAGRRATMAAGYDRADDTALTVRHHGWNEALRSLTLGGYGPTDGPPVADAGLLVAQRLGWLELGGAAGRDESKEHAGGAGDDKGDDDGIDGDGNFESHLGRNERLDYDFDADGDGDSDD